MRIEVRLHRHGRPSLDITPTVTGLTWTKSITAPWESLTVTWKATVRDAFALVSAGDWITLRAPTATSRGAVDGMILSLCHIDDIDHGVVNNGSVLQTTPITIKASSWWNLLQTVEVYAPFGTTEDVGTLFSMETWSRVASTSIDYTTGKLGEALQKVFSMLAAVELPESLTGLKLSAVIPVVHDVPTKTAFAPDRVVESVSLGGGAPTRMTSLAQAYEGRVGEVINGLFVSEPMLIELFPSFEPFPVNFDPPSGRNQSRIPAVPVDASGTESDQTLDRNETLATDGDLESSADGNPPVVAPTYDGKPMRAELAKLLGGWPVLLYRIKPFRTRALREAIVAWAEYEHYDTEFRAEKEAYSGPRSLQVSTQLSEADFRARASRDTRAAFAYNTDVLLDRIFKEDTWQYGSAKFIDKEHIRAVNFNRSDAKRINASSIVLGAFTGTGVEAIHEMGLPISYDEEIIRHGLRLLKPTWNYAIPALDSDEKPRSVTDKLTDISSIHPDLPSFLRAIVAQFMQFYKNNHMFSTGVAHFNLLDATQLKPSANQTLLDKVLYLKQGETVAVRLTDSYEMFYLYAETVTHTFQISNNNVISASTAINYSRGHLGVMRDALVDAVEVPLRDITEPPADTGDQTGQPVTTPRVTYANQPLNRPVDDVGDYILVNGVRQTVGVTVIHSYIDLSNPRLPSGVVLPRSNLDDVKLAILHYEGVNNNDPTAESIKAYFERKYVSYVGPTSDLGSVHFAIDYDGSIWQYVDCAITAAHAGPSPDQISLDGTRISPNPYSIGIGFINPVFYGKGVTAPESARKKWPVVTSTWTTKSTKGSRQHTNFLAASTQQYTACRSLLAALREAGIPIALQTSGDSIAEGAFRTIRRLTFKEKLAAISSGGVYHHLQWEANRFDSCGVEIDGLLR